MTVDVRLPDKWSKGSAGGPMFSTTITQVDSGDEHRIGKWVHPLHKYEIAHNVKTPADLAEIRAFHYVRRGKLESFLLKDWLDYSSASDGRSAASMLDQPLGTGDGALTTFQLVKRYSDGAGNYYDRPILWPVAGTLTVAADGVHVSSGVSVNRGTGVVTFTGAPADGVDLTAGFAFDVPVRFDEDWLSVTFDTINSQSAGSIPLVGVRS
jgi:uncharacterized protein (TIGR02217 family)